MTAALLTGAVWEWSRGAITTGDVVVASTLTLRVLSGSRELAFSLLATTEQLGALGEAIEVLRAPEEDEPPPVLPPLRPSAGTIELRGVRHAPDGVHVLFRDLDLRVP